MKSTAIEITADANYGFVGLNDMLQVSGGYDQQYDEAAALIPEHVRWDEDYRRMPAAERVLLADTMIGRWMKYRAIALHEALTK
jgi:hypothetical protein